jgi:hypothetical protein
VADMEVVATLMALAKKCVHANPPHHHHLLT